jgi:hypothetical protein
MNSASIVVLHFYKHSSIISNENTSYMSSNPSLQLTGTLYFRK